MLTLVAHTLAFIRLWLTQLADVCSNFTDSLLVNAAHSDLVIALDREGDSCGRIYRDRVRKTTSRELSSMAQLFLYHDVPIKASEILQVQSRKR